ncbi:MAG: hypothetical protein L0H83_11225 [Salinisphaera sp.]|nr:hypothetical protein [Salinisphaera sp.]
MLKEYRQVAGELQKIRDQARAANPELVSQGDVFQQQVLDAMRDTGYNVDEHRANIKALGTKLKGDAVPADQRKELVRQLLAERKQFRAAQAKALEKPQVKKAAQALNDATLAAMRAQDPDTSKLVARAKALRDQFQSMAQAAQ